MDSNIQKINSKKLVIYIKVYKYVRKGISVQ